jgi:hypothetical protein
VHLLLESDIGHEDLVFDLRLRVDATDTAGSFVCTILFALSS